MSRRRVTVELDAGLVEAARTVASRAGVGEVELYERALREVLARDFAELMNAVEVYQESEGEKLSDDAAMDLAKAELRAHRIQARR